MGWNAIETLEDAYEDTEDLLVPFDLGTWTRLALIVIFTGAGFNAPGVFSSFPSSPGTYSGEYTDSTSSKMESAATTSNMMTGNFMAGAPSFNTANYIIAAAIIVLIGIFLGFLYLNSVFEYIYFQSLIDKDVSIRKNFWKHCGNGLRFLGFKLIMLMILFAALAGGITLIIASPLMMIPLILAMLPLALILSIFNTAVHDFVLPEMIFQEQKLYESMKTVFPRIRRRWQEFLVYYIAKVLLSSLKALYTVSVLALLALVLAIPFGIAGALLFMLEPVLVLLAVIPGFFAWIILYIFIAEVPTQSYLYLYALKNYEKI